MNHIAFISHGKDSLKMLDVIKTRGLPLDRIITFDVWATDTILAEFPEVTAFKKRVDIYIKEKYGIEVEHLYSTYKNGEKITYEKEFYRLITKGYRAGTIVGFPFQRGAWCNSKLKTSARKGLINDGDVEYVGIAYDELHRYKLLSQSKVSPLELFGIDEDLCGLYCKYQNILSPTYDYSLRDGCWFCHNQSVNQLRFLHKKYPFLWSLLLKWDNDSPVTFKSDGHTVHDFDLRFNLEESGCVPKDRTFRWSMLSQDRQISLLF